MNLTVLRLFVCSVVRTLTLVCKPELLYCDITAVSPVRWKVVLGRCRRYRVHSNLHCCSFPFGTSFVCDDRQAQFCVFNCVCSTNQVRYIFARMYQFVVCTRLEALVALVNRIARLDAACHSPIHQVAACYTAVVECFTHGRRRAPLLYACTVSLISPHPRPVFLCFCHYFDVHARWRLGAQQSVCTRMPLRLLGEILTDHTCSLCRYHAGFVLPRLSACCGGEDRPS